MARLVYLIFVSSFVAGLAGCQPSSAAPPGKTDAPPPMPVSVSVPKLKEITDYEEFTGRIEAVERVEIRSRVTGYLDKIHFKEGSEVKQGDLLFTIDDKLYQSEYAAAKGAVSQAEARLQKATADLERAKNLRKTVGAMSQEEFDKINAERNEVDALIVIARANLDRAEKNLAYTKILAPQPGRISRKQLTEGNMVTADTTVLTDIVSVDPVHVVFDIDEGTILRIQTLINEGKFQSARTNNNVKVSMGLGNDTGFPYEGVIDFVDNKIDPKLGTMWVRGKFPNTVVANNNRRFTIGMFVRIRLPVGPPHQAILVSDRAIGTDQGNKFVFVIEEGNKAGYRPVKLGAMHEGYRVVESGIKPDDKVIVNGILRVRPDAVVAPKLIDMPVSAINGVAVQLPSKDADETAPAGKEAPAKK
jgi:RND family efflux transporter MFP subunit